MKLGRGLDSLLPQKPAAPASAMPEIAVALIDVSPYQARKVFSPEELKSLSDSIKTYGVLEPILVSEKGDGRYALLAGERRLRASKLAGLEKIPAIIKAFSGKEAAFVGLIENVQRKDLNCLELAEAVNGMIEQFGLTHEQASAAVGFSRPRISNLLRILQLPKEVLEYVGQGHLSEGQARALLALGSDEERIAVARKIALEEEAISVRDLEKKKRARRRDPNITILEEKLEQALKTKVKIAHHSKKNSGWVSLQYSSLEHFDQIYKKLVKG